MINLRNPCPPIRTAATKAHWTNLAPLDRPNRPNLTVPLHLQASRSTFSTRRRRRSARKVPSYHSRRQFVSRLQTEYTITLVGKVSGGFPMVACLGCATGAIVIRSSTPTRSCWITYRSSTSTRRRGRSHVSGMAARCTTRSPAAEGGWSGTCFPMAVPSRTSVL